MSDLLPSDPVATPKTDAASFLPRDIAEPREDDYVVPLDFARGQERTITALMAECKHYRTKLRELATDAQLALQVKKS